MDGVDGASARRSAGPVGSTATSAVRVVEFDVDDAPTAPERPPPAPAWVWLLTAALLVCSGVLTAPPRSTTDGLNLVASLAAPPTLAWNAPLSAERPSARLEAEQVGDVVVVTTDSWVAGYAVTSGEPLWQARAQDARCTYQDVVVCVTGRLDGARVLSIDPLDGAVASIDLTGALWAVRAENSDVLALRYATGYPEVVRIAPDGTVLWRSRVTFRPEYRTSVSDYPFARIGDVLYVGSVSPTILDARSGANLGHPLALQFRSSGVFGLEFDEPWWHLWSGERIDLADGSVPLEVDDAVGSGTQVVVAPSTGTAQVRDGVGEPVWSGAGGEEALARLAGVLITSRDGLPSTTQGIDMGSGAALWEAESMSCPCVGAGRTLVLSASATVPAGLTAIDVRTGLPTWQLAFGATTHTVELVDDGVVVATPDRVLFYRW